MADRHPIRDAGLAISLLTIIPTRATWPDDSRTQVAGWFPAVGLLLGGLAWLSLHGMVRLEPRAHGAFLMAALIVGGWALLTRLLHWDGLADVADGYWGSHEQTRRLEIMSDSHIGAFGSTAITLVAMTEVAAVTLIIFHGHEFPLLVVPVFARLAATFAAWFGEPAKPVGLGRAVMGRPRAEAIIATLIVVVPTILVSARVEHWSKGWLAVLSVLIALAVPHLLSRRFGGVTGDVMGASVLITETLVFVAYAVWF